MEQTFLLFYVTHPDEACARRISDVLLERKLIACANLFPITSAYWWNHEIAHESEWVSLLKTSLSLEATVEKMITAIHPYETPCILRFEVRANEAYVLWIKESTVAD
ncbi:MAG: divalent-cation tolerance protein CutA [Saprospiraceae bacterium]|nr:divalent-cation tolerance protein CutA [Saprospiraceae bacterium]